MTEQLSLDLADTDAQARRRQGRAASLARRDLHRERIYDRALAIHRGAREQDIRILCPVHADGYWCQWVAGHYGSCLLGRDHRQVRLV